MDMVSEIELVVTADVNPTEDPDKVKVAIQNVFGNLQLEVVENQSKKRLMVRADGTAALSSFRELLRRERILDAARKVLFRGTQEDSIIFYLNKQVAHAGHISFSQPEGESPLGPIQVNVRCTDPRAVIDWLAPKTVRY